VQYQQERNVLRPIDYQRKSDQYFPAVQQTVECSRSTSGSSLDQIGRFLHRPTKTKAFLGERAPGVRPNFLYSQSRNDYSSRVLHQNLSIESLDVQLDFVLNLDAVTI
jgi:hypothetical protein